MLAKKATMNFLLKAVAAPLIALLPAVVVSPSRSEESQAAKAPLYPDLPLEKLTRTIQDLEGLHPASGQERLTPILDKMAETIAKLLPRLPDLISREDVFRAENRTGPDSPQKIISLTFPGSGPISGTTITAQRPRGEEYRYLILCHRAANGSTSLEESRADLKGHPLVPKKGVATLGSGFAYQWLLFASANQSEFRFRFLGEQKMDGRDTFVLAFAQNPGQVRFPAVFQSAGKQAPYYYQGILWVDQATYNIVLLRSDIESPLKDPRLEQLTTELRFRSVTIHDFDQSLWLPGDVHIAIDQGTLTIDEQHHYSDYHLYHSTARILQDNP